MKNRSLMLAVSMAVAVAGCGDGSAPKSTSQEKKQTTLYSIASSGIDNHIANEMIEQYELSKKHGSFIDRCINAGVVVAAWQQAKDEDNYIRWKTIQRSDCAKAGIPNM